MKKMKTKLVSLLLVVVVVLAGCATEEVSLKIHSNGTGEIVQNVVVYEDELMKNVAKAYKAMGMADSQMAMLETEIKKTMAEIMKETGLKESVINGRKCYQMSQRQSIKKGKLTNDFVGDGNDSCVAGYVTTDTFYVGFNLYDMLSSEAQQIPDMGDKQQIEEMLQMVKASGIDLNTALVFNINVEFPKAVVATNGNIDKTNKNKVSFKVSAGAAGTVTMFATTNPKVTLKSAAATYKAANKIRKPKIKKLKQNSVSRSSKKVSATLKFDKVKGAKKYQVQYATKASFKKAKTKTTKKTTYKIKNLKKNKKYYVRVRAVKYNFGGQEIYSAWAKKTIKVKK